MRGRTVGRKEGWLRLAKVAGPVEEEVLVSVQRMLQQERVQAYAEGILVWPGFAPDLGTAGHTVHAASHVPLHHALLLAWVP
jgi:hypothetical protein